MATKSILKTVYIKDNNAARRLASALENAHGKKSKTVTYSRPVSEASRDSIKKIFSGSLGAYGYDRDKNC